MSFFDSDVVRAEMTEISELQEDVYRNVFKFPSMNKEEKKFHVAMLERLLDKQRILYTRLSLSDDPDAEIMKQEMTKSAEMMGLPRGVDMSVIFNQMSEMIELMRKQFDIGTFQYIIEEYTQAKSNLIRGNYVFRRPKEAVITRFIDCKTC